MTVSDPVRWRGLSAVYTADERQIMSQLAVKEQAFVHTLKATIDGEISQCDRADTIAPSGTSLGEMIGNAQRLDAQRHPQRLDQPLRGHGEGAGFDPPVDRAAILFTAPEDIEFGRTKRKRPIYALSWTWQKSRVYKTKGKAQVKLRVWKRWYERLGWKVVNAGSGYIAVKGTERHGITLHEYDAATLERIR